MKNLLFVAFLAFTINGFSQTDKTVTLVVSGQGKTQEEAKQNALRSAIEQAFGMFISSKTEILNDNLVKDEIVSVSSGNIQKYEVISAVQIPNGGYATSLNATVSLDKLTTFVESRGALVEFKGALFGANLKLQKFNEEAEFKSIINLCEVSNIILSKSLDYSIEVKEPVKAKNDLNYQAKQDNYQILLNVRASPNKNFDKFVDFFYSNIKALSMPVNEQEDYKKINKQIYCLSVKEYPETEKYYFRNSKTCLALQNLFIKSNKYIHNFKIVSNIDSINVRTCCVAELNMNEVQNIFKKAQYTAKQQHEIWELNDDPTSEIKYGSLLTKNSGFPDYIFGDVENYSLVKSWGIYSAYLNELENNKILFDNNTYFTADIGYYYLNGKPINYKLTSKYPSIDSGGIVNIGKVHFTKKLYFNTYIAVYTEDEVFKLTDFSVQHLNN